VILACVPALAETADGVVRIGVLIDLSSLGADITRLDRGREARGGGFRAAAKGIRSRSSAPTISTSPTSAPASPAPASPAPARRDKVDAIVDLPNSGVGLAVTR